MDTHLSNSVLITFYRRFFNSAHSIAKQTKHSVSAHNWATSFSNITYAVFCDSPHASIICTFANITTTSASIEMYNTSPTSSVSVSQYSCVGIGY